jgi:DNA-directed RNA polymerase subunit omega
MKPGKNMLHRRSQYDSTQIMYRAEELVNAASNRYKITVQVANRAKRRRYEELDSIDDPMMKPVLRAIVEMSDEITQPEIIGDDQTSYSSRGK